MIKKRSWSWAVSLIVLLALITSGCGAQPVISVNNGGDNTAAPSSASPVIQPTEKPPSTKTPSKDKQLAVHFIDVGQGGSQLIVSPSGKTMLIDAGNNDKEAWIVQYLQQQNIKKIDILIGTHPDADHIGGLDAVIDNFEIGKFYMPKIQANTKTFEDVLLAAKKKKLKVATAKSGLELEFDKQVDVTMIAPINDYKDTNEMSAVVRLEYGKTSFLLTGDAESKSEADMLAAGIALNADVLLVSHHGSKTSTSDAFLKAVKPTYAVIQSGKDNKYGHPAGEVLERLKKKKIKVHRNDLEGSIIFTSNGEDIKIATVKTKENNSSSTATTKPSANTEKSDSSKEATAVKTIKASASIDQSAPQQNATVTVTVKVTDDQKQPVKGAKIKLVLAYKSKDSEYEATTDKDGNATLSFQIGRAATGFKVNGTITATYGKLSATAKTSFIPQ